MGNGFNPPVRKTPHLLRAAKTLCFRTRHAPRREIQSGISGFASSIPIPV
jgi:hypothetical protein